jgi:hypothetical protein
MPPHQIIKININSLILQSIILQADFQVLENTIFKARLLHILLRVIGIKTKEEISHHPQLLVLIPQLLMTLTPNRFWFLNQAF